MVDDVYSLKWLSSIPPPPPQNHPESSFLDQFIEFPALIPPSQYTATNKTALATTDGLKIHLHFAANI